MNEQFKKPPLRTLVLITNTRLADKSEQLFKQSHLPICYQLRGQGTASSEIMDLLGFGGDTKAISLSLMPKSFAELMIKRLDNELGLGKSNTGIAFTTAITGISTPAMKLLDENIRNEYLKNMESDVKQMLSECNYSLIVAVVNQGFSEEMMDAARQAGAQGGTVLNARQTSSREAMSFWGISVQDEKELVLIITSAENKLQIMTAISETCGMHSEAKGIIFSSPIDMLVGLQMKEGGVS